ncbi:MAG: protein kinase [Acidobacteriota bacterium]
MEERARALKLGSRLGDYRVHALLGVGGMGEVYQARDERLGREVAIKLLPEQHAEQTETLARFEREARLLASVNHPNIASIYGIQDVGGVRALVLELVPGETLQERLGRGALPLAKTLEMASQIVDALAAAHEKGIVHRDLKPANVKVTPSGVVKLLDFGLAKIESPGAEEAGFSRMPTLDEGTRSGVILGTPAYMSPEQARGLAVDKRTDIWAFGCLMFALLTGREAFAGATFSDTIAGILEREPDWGRLPASTPASIRRLLRSSLEKDPERRLRDVADARPWLEAAAETEEKEASPATRSSPFVRWLPWCATAVAVAGALFIALREPSRVGEPATLEPLTYDPGLSMSPALSPDGRLLGYASDRSGRGDMDIWVQQTTGGTPLRITDDPADDDQPNFSPDGSQIVFRSERDGGGIYLVSTLGGAARRIVPDGYLPRFSPDGSRIAYQTGNSRAAVETGRFAIYVLTLAGGLPQRQVPEFAAATYPVWAPDGNVLLFLGRRDAKSQLPDSFDLWLASLDGRAAVRTGLLDTAGLRGSSPVPGAWTRDGVWFSAGSALWIAPVSPSSGRLTGPAHRVAQGLGAFARPAASQEGRVALSVIQLERTVERASLKDTTLPASQVYSDTHSQDRSSQNRDGTVLAVALDFPSRGEVWLVNLVTGVRQVVARMDLATANDPVLSLDGSRVAFTSKSHANGTADPHGKSQAFVVEAAGGVPRVLCEDCQVWGFISDNHGILATREGAGAWLLDVVTGARQDVLTNADGRTSLNRMHASPDDRWLAFRGGDGSSGKVFVAPLAPGTPSPLATWQEVQEPTTTGRPCGWSPDSTVLYLLLDADGFRCLWGQRIDPTSGRLVGGPFPVRHFHTRRGDFSTSFGNAVGPEGFLFEGTSRTGNIFEVLMPRP